jgi:hypothetical protein
LALGQDGGRIYTSFVTGGSLSWLCLNGPVGDKKGS